MKYIARFFLLVWSLFIFTQSVMANEQLDLKNHLLTKIDEVILIVQDKSLSKSKRNSDIIHTLQSIFDFEIMAKLSLGKNTWNELGKDEQKRFTELYVKRMEKSYSSKLDAYTDEKVEIKEILQPKENRIYFVTDLVNGGEKLEVTYKFYKPKETPSSKHHWLIYDVEILGVSILKADSAQFKDFLKTKTIAQLMDALDK
ncbi:MAG: ABC transporter substrate-binding protein [Helicobacteraceae bacterium]|nr:ABC transporter substrate-binding protein [Candidatus Sulfurimonas ponti]MBL6972912.1 ABC transporter substrate-binding protein [Sulfurimonas sp.]